MTQAVGSPPLWRVPEGRAERLALAKSYPFAIPEGSYLLEGGTVHPREGFDAAELRGRTPVLAVGSNQSPEHLGRKFAHMASPARVPVTRAWLDDFDIVYCTRITRYASLPANLHHAPGTRVRLSVTWLDEAQLTTMHVTEVPTENFVFARLSGVRLEIKGGRILDSCFGYVSLPGNLRHDGAPVGLAAIRAEGRQHPALDQPAILAMLHARIGSALPLDDFLIELIERPERRRALNALLHSDALPFTWTKLEVVAR
jgi:hypothetical protein